MLWQFQQLGLIYQVQAKRFAALGIVAPAGYLDQAPPPVLGAVALHGITQICPALVLGLGRGRPLDFSHILQLA